MLNSCEGARTSRLDPFAGSAQSLIQQGIPAVVAMQFEISDEVAIVIADEFYSALAAGYPVDAALAEARKAAFTDGSGAEWGIPVLFCAAADGRIFGVTPPTQGALASGPRRPCPPNPSPYRRLLYEPSSTGRPAHPGRAALGVADRGPARRPRPGLGARQVFANHPAYSGCGAPRREKRVAVPTTARVSPCDRQHLDFDPHGCCCPWRRRAVDGQTAPEEAPGSEQHGLEPRPHPSRRRRVGGQQRRSCALEGGRHEHRLYGRRRSAVQSHGALLGMPDGSLGSGKLLGRAHYAGRRQPGPGSRLRRA